MRDEMGCRLAVDVNESILNILHLNAKDSILFKWKMAFCGSGEAYNDFKFTNSGLHGWDLGYLALTRQRFIFISLNIIYDEYYDYTNNLVPDPTIRLLLLKGMEREGFGFCQVKKSILGTRFQLEEDIAKLIEIQKEYARLQDDANSDQNIPYKEMGRTGYLNKHLGKLDYIGPEYKGLNRLVVNGRFYKLIGDNAGASVALNEALRLEPDNVAAQFELRQMKSAP
jgi:hypothetical protein